MDLTLSKEYTAANLNSSQRESYALKMFSDINVSKLADKLNVSRKFLYKLKHKATKAITTGCMFLKFALIAQEGYYIG